VEREGERVKRFGRWIVAGVVTVAAFALSTWFGGAVLGRIHDSGIRWGLASALGLAVSGLAALWGKTFAIRTQEKTGKPGSTGTSVQASGPRSIAIGGDNSGNVSTGNQSHRSFP
jgi:hypothetical protein